jgi:hypothetical protein
MEILAFLEKHKAELPGCSIMTAVDLVRHDFKVGRSQAYNILKWLEKEKKIWVKPQSIVVLGDYKPRRPKE